MSVHLKSREVMKEGSRWWDARAEGSACMRPMHCPDRSRVPDERGVKGFRVVVQRIEMQTKEVGGSRLQLLWWK